VFDRHHYAYVSTRSPRPLLGERRLLASRHLLLRQVPPNLGNSRQVEAVEILRRIIDTVRLSFEGHAAALARARLFAVNRS